MRSDGLIDMGMIGVEPIDLGLGHELDVEAVRIDENDEEWTTALNDMTRATADFIHQNDDLPNESEYGFRSIENPLIRVNYTCTTLPLAIKDKMKLRFLI